MPYPARPIPIECLFEIDGTWVKALCARFSDYVGGWLVEVSIADMPDGKTKNGLLELWQEQHANVWDRPSMAQFHAADDDERLKLLTGETRYF